MNDFDFSIYDYDDEPIQNQDSKIQEPIRQIKNTESKGDFDFDLYDYDEKPKVASANKGKNPFAVAPISKEDYEKKSFFEKVQYAKDLEKELEYESSKAFSKNAASALSFGFSEDYEGYKPEEGEDPIAGFAGGAIGSIPKYYGAGKIVGAVLGAAPKGLEAVYRLMHAFGTGATAEIGEQAANAVRGEDVDLSKIYTVGTEFATVDAIIQGAGALGKRFLAISPKHQAKIVEEGIIPKDLPKSQYETAEEMLQLIEKQKAQPEILPAPLKASNNLHEEIGDLFSKEKFHNTTEGGKAFKKEIMNLDEDVYRGVNQLYKKSRDLNKGIDDIHPQLVSKLEARNAELKAIPEPSNVQKRVIRAQNKILNNLVQYENILDETGKVIGKEITGYKPINNQTLIDQVQSLRQIIDYDFAHGNTNNIFKPLINDLQDSALRSAENSGNKEAANALNDAKIAYRQWVEAFDNPYVRPFRDASNEDYSKLFKSALDFDESNMLRKILRTSDNGKKLLDASTREIVEKNLSKYFEKPQSVNPRDFDKSIRELEAVISPEQSKQVRDIFYKTKSHIEISEKPHIPRTPTNDEIMASKYAKKKPEDIQEIMNTRSGIKELRADANTPQKKVVFERLQQQKIRSILREGNIEKDFTGDDLYRFLNKEKNYEILSEILGESETEALRLSAKEIGKKQVRSEVRQKNITKGMHKVAAIKSIEFLFNLL